MSDERRVTGDELDARWGAVLDALADVMERVVLDLVEFGERIRPLMALMRVEGDDGCVDGDGVDLWGDCGVECDGDRGGGAGVGDDGAGSGVRV